MGAWDVVVTRPGGRGPVSLPIAGMACSWVVSDRGSASVEVETEDARRAGLLPDPRGRWLSWEHPTLGVWAGLVVRCLPDLETGRTELVCATWDALLARRRLPKDHAPGQGTAGALLRRAVAAASASRQPIRLHVAADETGDLLPGDGAAEDVADLLRDLVAAGVGEYRVDHAARTLHWRRRVGRDLSASVTLVEGRHVVGGRPDYDLDPVVNDLLAVADGEPFGRAPSVVAQQAASVAVLGARQGTEVLPGLPGTAALGTAAKALVRRLAARGVSLSLDLTDALPDPTDRVWARFREGDTVGVLLPSCGVDLRMRVMVRSWDSERGLLTIDGEEAT